MTANDIVKLSIFDDHPSVLDFGCGDGKCLPIWETRAKYAVGYDEMPDNGFNTKPLQQFDVVVMKHVITIGDTIGSAAAKIDEASEYVALGGHLCIVIGDMIDYDLIKLIVETAENFERFDIEQERRGELIVARKRTTRYGHKFH